MGWVTGHSYVVYGPLANGATTVMYEGASASPGPDRLLVHDRTPPRHHFLYRPDGDPHLHAARARVPRQARLFFPAPARHGGRADQSRGLAVVSAGHRRRRCPIVDTWWQTETGAIMISPCREPPPPSRARRPCLSGHRRRRGRTAGAAGAAGAGGFLVIKRPWPGMLRTIYGDPKSATPTSTSARSPGCISPAMGAQGQGRLLLGPRAHRRRAQCLRATAVDHGDRIGAGQPSRGGRGRRRRPA